MRAGIIPAFFCAVNMYRYIVKPYYAKQNPERVFLVYDKHCPEFDELRQLQPNHILKGENTVPGVAKWFTKKGIPSRLWRFSVPATVHAYEDFYELLRVAESID